MHRDKTCLIQVVVSTTTGRGNEDSGSVFTNLETDFHTDIICTVEPVTASHLDKESKETPMLTKHFDEIPRRILLCQHIFFFFPQNSKTLFCLSSISTDPEDPQCVQARQPIHVGTILVFPGLAVVQCLLRVALAYVASVFRVCEAFAFLPRGNPLYFFRTRRNFRAVGKRKMIKTTQ